MSVDEKLCFEVPVYVAVTSPFTNVVFDNEEPFQLSLEDVNSGNYDRLKFCRTTLAVSGDIEAMNERNMAVIITYSGCMLFPRLPGLEKQSVIDACNAILLRLLFGGIEFDAVVPEDVGYGSVCGTGYFMLSGGCSGSNYQQLMHLQQDEATANDLISLMSPRYYSQKEFNTTLQDGLVITTKIPEVNPSIFLNGMTFFKTYQLAPSLVFSWSTAETLIGKIWSEKVVPSGSGIAGRRKFIESNSWQAANKTEVLFQIGLISEELYDLFREFRTS